MHLNFKGAEFDTWHKLLGDLYKELREDADALYEWAVAYGINAPNPNGAAARIEFQSTEGACDNTSAPYVLDVLLKQLLEYIVLMYCAANRAENDPLVYGLQDWLSGCLQRWTKQAHYFNGRRMP